MSFQKSEGGAASSSRAVPRVWPVYALFVLSLVAMGLATVGLLSASFALRHPGEVATRAALTKHALEPTTFIFTILVSGVTLTALSLTAAALSPRPLAERLSLSLPKGGIFPMVAAMVGLPALSMVIENVALFSGVEINGTLEMIAKTIGSARGLESVFVVLAISLGPGIGEELLFRGYIQTRLLERHAPLVAILVTSLLFGLMHMDPLQSVLTVFMGAYLGFLVHRFGSLWPAVGAHALNNGIAALTLSLFPEESATVEPSLLGILLGGAVFAACLAFVLKKVPRKASASRWQSQVHERVS